MSKAAEELRERPERVSFDATQTGINVALAAPHNDDEGWGRHLRNALGSASTDFVEALLSQISTAVPDFGDASGRKRLNFALAFIEAIRPRDEAEAVLAAQMLATQALSMDGMRRARGAHDRAAYNDYINASTKLSRTFVAQTEALAKLRNAGRQIIEVQHVHVYPGGQAVVGTVNQGGGDGRESLGQSHAGEMLGADALGAALPILAGAGPEALPDARGNEPGRAEGIGERQLARRRVDRERAVPFPEGGPAEGEQSSPEVLSQADAYHAPEAVVA